METRSTKMSTLAKKRAIDFTNGPILKNILIFIWPLLVHHFLQTIFNSVGMMVVSKFSPNGAIAMGAMSASGPMLAFLMNIISGVSAATGILVALRIGAHDEKEVERIILSSAVFSFIGGTVLMVIGIATIKPFLTLTSVPDSMMSEATAYMVAYYMGFPIMMVLNSMSASLRASGDTYHTMIFMSIAGAASLLSTTILVFGFGLGAVSSGVGVTVMQIVGGSLIIRHMMKLDGMCRFSFKRLRLAKDVIKGILITGVPIGLQNGITPIANMFVQSCVNTFGDVVITGAAAADTFPSYIGSITNALAVALLTIVSQNIGAKKYDRVKKMVIIIVLSVVVIGLLMGLACYIFREPLLGLYISDDDALDPALVMEAAELKLLIYCVPYFLYGVVECLSNSLNGMKKTGISVTVSMICLCGVRVVWTTVATALFPESVGAIYLSSPVSWFITVVVDAIILVAAFKKFSKNKPCSNEVIAEN